MTLSAEQREQVHVLQGYADAIVAALRRGAVAGLCALPELPAVRLRLSARLTRSAGMYRPGGDVALSTYFLAAHGPERARGVLLHELAHHIVRARHGPRVAPHGREFRAVAAALGAELHAAAFPSPRTLYAYRCPGCGWEWLRGRRIARGRGYSCARCAQGYDRRFRLRFAGRRRLSA